MAHKKPQIGKLILRKKNKAEGITLPDFKLYYKTVTIRTVQYWHKNRYIEWNRISGLEIFPHIYVQLIFYTEAKNNH